MKCHTRIHAFFSFHFLNHVLFVRTVKWIFNEPFTFTDSIIVPNRIIQERWNIENKINIQFVLFQLVEVISYAFIFQPIVLWFSCSRCNYTYICRSYHHAYSFIWHNVRRICIFFKNRWFSIELFTDVIRLSQMSIYLLLWFFLLNRIQFFSHCVFAILSLPLYFRIQLQRMK